MDTTCVLHILVTDLGVLFVSSAARKEMSVSNLTPVVMKPSDRRDRIREAALTGVKDLFPIIGDHRQMEIDNIRVEKKDYSAKDFKNAVLNGRTLGEQVKADVIIRDSSGQILDTKKNHSLMRVPYFTPQNTFIVKGNEYAVRHQLRTMPGVYTRRRGNDDLEASFNLAKGANFRVSMDPNKGHLNMEYGTTKIPLYPVLRGLGLSHSDVAGSWGPGVADRNRDAFDNKRDKHIDRLYSKLVPKRHHGQGLSQSDKISAISERYGATEIDPYVTKKTLGESHERVGPLALLSASRKLLNVHKGEDTPDERDSLEFQTLHSPEAFVWTFPIYQNYLFFQFVF